MLCFIVIFVGFLRISVIVGCLFKKQTLTAENYSITPNKKKKKLKAAQSLIPFSHRMPIFLCRARCLDLKFECIYLPSLCPTLEANRQFIRFTF